MLAGVSSFGVGGTNCHLVLGEPPAAGVERVHARASQTRRDEIAVGAARRRVHACGSCRAAGNRPCARRHERLGEQLDVESELDAGDVGYSLAVGRTAFDRRAVIVGDEREELLTGLGMLAREEPAGNVVEGVASGGGDGVVFVFPGQGSQWEGMALGLLDRSPVFAERMHACADALAEHVDWSLLDVLRGVGRAPRARPDRRRPAGAVRGDGVAGGAVASLRRATRRGGGPLPGGDRRCVRGGRSVAGGRGSCGRVAQPRA